MGKAILPFLGLCVLGTLGCLTTIDTPPPDIEATVQAAVEAALPTPPPTTTPDIEATVQASIRATTEAQPTPIPSPTSTPPPTLTPTPIPTPTLIPTPSLASIVEKVRPGVVRIDTTFSSGSGAIFESNAPDGSALVITNFHVIEGSSEVNVTVNDSTKYTGTVLGVDQPRDLAVVRICCGSFNALPFGDADNLPDGSEVVAIGYALGILGSATITRGIVSATRYDSDNNRWVIQIDAPINPGNSGGPLFTLDGKVIGINSFKVEATTGGRPAEGIGFAISEKTVQSQLPLLKSNSYAALATPTPRPFNRSSTYYNRVHGYSIEVAPGWNLEESNGGRDVHINFESAEFAIFVSALSGKTLEALAAETILLRARESPLFFEFLGIEQTVDGTGINAVAISYRSQGSQEYCLSRSTEALISLGQKVYQLVGSICETSLTHLWPDSERMITSFKP